MSVTEARRSLRRLELEAYAAIVSAFRAEGQLTLEKKASLTQLSQLLSISADRHHAEVRRAICDETLSYIANCVCGSESKYSWLPEGRRLGRGNPRLVSRHAFSLPLCNVNATVKGNKVDTAAMDEPSDKKLPPQVQLALKAITTYQSTPGARHKPPSVRTVGSQTDELSFKEMLTKSTQVNIEYEDSDKHKTTALDHTFSDHSVDSILSTTSIAGVQCRKRTASDSIQEEIHSTKRYRVSSSMPNLTNPELISDTDILTQSLPSLLTDHMNTPHISPLPISSNVQCTNNSISTAATTDDVSAKVNITISSLLNEVPVNSSIISTVSLTSTANEVPINVNVSTVPLPSPLNEVPVDSYPTTVSLPSLNNATTLSLDFMPSPLTNGTSNTTTLSIDPFLTEIPTNSNCTTLSLEPLPSLLNKLPTDNVTPSSSISDILSLPPLPIPMSAGTLSLTSVSINDEIPFRDMVFTKLPATVDVPLSLDETKPAHVDSNLNYMHSQTVTSSLISQPVLFSSAIVTACCDSTIPILATDTIMSYQSALGYNPLSSAKSDSLILCTAHQPTIATIPTIAELTVSTQSKLISVNDDSKAIFASTTPLVPTSDISNVDENVLLEAVTTELGVDSIDPSLLNMSDLLSLLQPEDSLNQLALTTDQGTSEMIVLQHSDELGIEHGVNLNLNEDELLQDLPPELRETVQAILDSQKEMEIDF